MTSCVVLAILRILIAFIKRIKYASLRVLMPFPDGDFRDECVRTALPLTLDYTGRQLNKLDTERSVNYVSCIHLWNAELDHCCRAGHSLWQALNGK